MRPLLASLTNMLLFSRPRLKKPPSPPPTSNPPQPSQPSQSSQLKPPPYKSFLLVSLALTLHHFRHHRHPPNQKPAHPPLPPPLTNLRTKPHNITIVTTSTLPWFTGTSVNPLLRAIYLARDGGHDVEVVVPWVENKDVQRMLYAGGVTFGGWEEMGDWILGWVRGLGLGVGEEEEEGVGVGVCEEGGYVVVGKDEGRYVVVGKDEGRGRGRVKLLWYEGVYVEEFGSILMVGSVTDMLKRLRGDRRGEVCVLEEPEHLTWHHCGVGWRGLFGVVVGVVHTNYLEYAKKYGWFGPQRAFFLRVLNMWVCKSYCDRVIKLSDAVQFLPHSVTCNVHGVRRHFIEIGKRFGREGRGGWEKGAYFLGKVLWAKGYRPLVKLMEQHFVREGRKNALPIDFFGSGPDLGQVKERVRKSEALGKVKVHGVYVDHASPFLQPYKVCVNPSRSDVVCTVTAEALAMGKFVVCLQHPSNAFFSTFPNCLTYRTPRQFSQQVLYALNHEPQPLSEHDMYRLSWEAATHRFYDAVGSMNGGAKGGVSSLDSAMAATHKTLSGFVTPPSMKIMRKQSRERLALLENSDGRGDGRNRRRNEQQTMRRRRGGGRSTGSIDGSSSSDSSPPAELASTPATVVSVAS